MNQREYGMGAHRPGKQVNLFGFGSYSIRSGQIRVYVFFSGIRSSSGMIGSGSHSGHSENSRSDCVRVRSFRVRVQSGIKILNQVHSGCQIF